MPSSVTFWVSDVGVRYQQAEGLRISPAEKPSLFGVEQQRRIAGAFLPRSGLTVKGREFNPHPSREEL